VNRLPDWTDATAILTYQTVGPSFPASA
jgi:hypothetical protein